MQKKYWEEIAKMFNLKLYERFTIIRPEDKKWDPTCKYYFHDSGLTVILPDGKEEKTLQELFELINGRQYYHYLFLLQAMNIGISWMME